MAPFSALQVANSGYSRQPQCTQRSFSEAVSVKIFYYILISLGK